MKPENVVNGIRGVIALVACMSVISANAAPFDEARRAVKNSDEVIDGSKMVDGGDSSVVEVTGNKGEGTKVPPVPLEVQTVPEDDEARRKAGLLLYLGARVMDFEEQVSLEATAKAAQEAKTSDLCLIWWQEGSMACPSQEAKKKYEGGQVRRAIERNRHHSSAAEDTLLGIIYFSRLMLLDQEYGKEVPRLVAQAFTLLAVRDATLLRLGVEGWMIEKAPSKALNPEGRSTEKAAEVSSMRAALAKALERGDVRFFLRELFPGGS